MPSASSATASQAGTRTGEPAARPLPLWERIAFGAVRALMSAVMPLLGLQGFYGFGRVFGTLEWIINYKRRARFVQALRRVLGREPTPGERRRWTLEHFRQTRCDKLLYLLFDRIPEQRVHELLSITNVHLLDEALARGRGAYVACGHHGALHVVALMMALRGYPLVFVRDRNESALRRYVQDRVERRYPQLKRLKVLFSGDYPREIFRCFQSGSLVASAMDVSRVRSPHQRVEELTVFGEKRPFLTGPLRVAFRSGAPALQAHIVSQPGFRYRLELVATLLDPSQRKDEESAVGAAIRVYAANLERFVRESPSQLTRL